MVDIANMPTKCELFAISHSGARSQKKMSKSEKVGFWLPFPTPSTDPPKYVHVSSGRQTTCPPNLNFLPGWDGQTDRRSAFYNGASYGRAS